jgi:hypothetical protein
MIKVSVVLPVLVSFATLASPPRQAFAQQDSALYEAKCGRCHVAYDPSDFSAEEWPGIVRSMRAQAALNIEDEEAITEYLLSLTGEGEDAPVTVSHSPSLGGYIYTEYFQTPDRRSNFDIHYLAFYAYGWINDKIYYFGEFELEHGGTGGNNTFVEQAYLDYWFVPNVAVKIGAILTPYNRFDEFHDPLMNYLVTRPQVSREIGVSAWKDVGVDVHGYLNITPTSSVGFDAYVINGLGDGSRLRGSRQYRDNNENLAVGGRVNVMHGDIIEIGGSYYTGKWDDDGMYNLRLLGAHVLLNTPVADIYGEYSNGNSENGPGVADGDMSGFFVQASRLFESKYRATVRYGDLDYLDTRTLADGPVTTDRDQSEFVFGFTYYPTSKVAFKLEYNFFLEGSRATQEDNNQLGIQAAVKF